MQEAGAGTLLEAALTRENLQAAWKRVKANKGAAGVDGLDIEQTHRLLQTTWPQIRQELLAGKYRPAPVRRVMIPKPDGSQRELGIPTVTDRLIQQALLQVLQPLAQQRHAAQQCAAGRLLRPVGRTPPLMTSSARTARCGPACRVVWEGFSRQ